MDERKLYNGMTVIALMVLFALIGLSLLASCTTKEIVTKETITVHDTLWSHSTDTIMDVKVYTIHDTLRYAETHTITLNNVGDTIKEIHHFHEKENVIVVDSTNRYKAVVDSLKAVLREKSNAKTEIKSVKKWRIYSLIAIVCVAFGIAVGALVLTKIKK